MVAVSFYIIYTKANTYHITTHYCWLDLAWFCLNLAFNSLGNTFHCDYWILLGTTSLVSLSNSPTTYYWTRLASALLKCKTGLQRVVLYEIAHNHCFQMYLTCFFRVNRIHDVFCVLQLCGWYLCWVWKMKVKTIVMQFSGFFVNKSHQEIQRGQVISLHEA